MAPRIHPALNLKERLVLQVDAELHAAISQHARDQMESTSSWLRRAAVDRLAAERERPTQRERERVEA